MKEPSGESTPRKGEISSDIHSAPTEAGNLQRKRAEITQK